MYSRSACVLSLLNVKSSETPYSVAFPYMVTSRRIIPVVVILLVFIILHPVNSSAHARALDISSSFESTTYLVMPPKGKLSRKRATREGHRTTVKPIAYEVNEQLDTIPRLSMFWTSTNKRQHCMCRSFARKGNLCEPN